MIKGLIGISLLACMPPLGAFHIMDVVGYWNHVRPIIELGEGDDMLLSPRAFSLEERMYFSVAQSLIEDVQEMLPGLTERDPQLESRLFLILHQFSSDINMPSDVEPFNMSEDELNENQELYRVTLSLFLNHFDRLLAEDLNVFELKLLHDLAFYSLYCNMGEFEVAHSWMQSAHEVLGAIQELSFSATSTSWE